MLGRDSASGRFSERLLEVSPCVSSEYTSTQIQIFPIFRQIFKNAQTHQKCRRPEADLPLPTSMLNFDPGSVGSSMVVVGKMVDFWWISAVFRFRAWILTSATDPTQVVRGGKLPGSHPTFLGSQTTQPNLNFPGSQINFQTDPFLTLGPSGLAGLNCLIW